ncbi:Spindle and kinetochore-associated protein 1 [Chamberlinius hualienensis]
MAAYQAELDFYPLCSTVWRNLFRIKTLFKDWDSCHDVVEEERICAKLRTTHNELQDIMESVHGVMNYSRKNQQIANELQAQMNAIFQATSAIYEQIHGKYTIESAAADASQDKSASSVNKSQITEVTKDEFLSIPGYLKGRLTVIQVNECVAMVNKALARKYEIMKLPRNTLKPKERLMQDLYKKQNKSIVKGTLFITTDDLKQFAGFQASTANKSKLILLRHLNRLKEIREPQEPVRYVVC